MIRKKPANHESNLQRACVKWFRMQYKQYILFSIPNGSKRNVITAAILKQEGVLSGVPDLMLLHRAKGFSGMFIEMKYGKNKLSPAQAHFISVAEHEGFKCVVCYTVDEFIKEVNNYLN